MIREFRASDCYMTLSDASAKDYAVFLPGAPISAGMRALWKMSEVAYVWCDQKKKPCVAWGYYKNGNTWVSFAKGIHLPMTFYKEIEKHMETASWRYGAIRTHAIMDTDDEKKFHKRFCKLVKAHPAWEYTLSGHKMVVWERRCVP